MTARDASLLVWGLIGALVVGVQVAAIVTRGQLPGFGTLLARISARRVGWVLCSVGWMWLGWHAFAR